MERPQDVTHEFLLKPNSKSGFKCKQREYLMEERIDGIDIWDKHGHRVIYKVLEMLQ